MKSESHLFLSRAHRFDDTDLRDDVHGLANKVVLTGQETVRLLVVSSELHERFVWRRQCPPVHQQYSGNLPLATFFPRTGNTEALSLKWR